MDFTAEAMQKTLDIANPDLHVVEDVNGIKTTHSTKKLFQVKADAPPETPRVEISTLAGFADLVRSNLEGQDFPSNWLIHVEGERTVALIGRLADKFGRRSSLILAQPVSFKQFQFGQWIPQEEFAINLASLFEDAGDKQYVLNMASSLTNDAATTADDDGFTQRVNLKSGLRMKESATIKPRVDLAPYRTFPELAQPVSSFVLRAKCDGNAMPYLMLVEADGGKWKIDAIAKIKAAMEAFGLAIPIIA